MNVVAPRTRSLRAKPWGGEPTASTNSAALRRFTLGSLITLFALMLLAAYLSPFAYMGATSLKDLGMISDARTPLLPSAPATFTHEGRDYPVYRVPTAEGERALALIEPGREQSVFVDPADPQAQPIVWDGRWRQLTQEAILTPKWDNYGEAWSTLNFPRLLRNTLAIALIGGVGTVVSSIAVAYGFSRFRIPYKGLLFGILLATIVLPRFITLVPTYAVFAKIGWVGTWLPLIVPHFFANAYNVFLLRQYFLTIPSEIDEAAMVDGAGPLRILVSVLLPQAIPAIVAVGLFHFFFAWNDFLEPLLYLSARPDLQPISVGMQVFSALFAQRPHLIQASALLGMALPVAIFFVAQRVFLRGASLVGYSK
ncbi:MAG TPA: carbohydrate ABC transporter permease [Egibacteraceae bacterium]|nr:carbohydrate ABC transporter permease [Egibacteraceae bacterium]